MLFFPVREAEARNAGEFFLVVGDECEGMCKSCCSDQQIVGTDWCPRLLQVTPDSPVDVEASLVERKGYKGLEEPVEESEIVCGARTPIGAENQLRFDDGAQKDLAGVRVLYSIYKRQRCPVQESNTGVGVEQKHYRPRRSRDSGSP